MGHWELSTTHPRARKEYHCDWCNELINIQEKHLKRVYVYDGELRSDRMHLECERAMDKVPRGTISEGWLAGEFKRGSSEAA